MVTDSTFVLADAFERTGDDRKKDKDRRGRRSSG
jgi:hypothetical protein